MNPLAPEQDNSIMKALDSLSDANKINFFTELSSKEIRNIAIILFLADYLGLPEYTNFVNNVLQLKVSKNRKGRAEFLDGFKEAKIQEQKEAVIKDKILSGKI